MTKATYAQAVKKCKSLVKMRKQLKYDIAKISLGVIPITGGQAGARAKYLYSVNNFADDIGVAKSSLKQWRREYVQVVSKLKLKKGTIPMNKIVKQTLKDVNIDTTPAEVRDIFNKNLVLNEDKEYIEQVEMNKRLSTIDFQINHKFILGAINQDELRRTLHLTESITTRLKAHFTGKQDKKTTKIRKAVEAVQHLTA